MIDPFSGGHTNLVIFKIEFDMKCWKFEISTKFLKMSEILKIIVISTSLESLAILHENALPLFFMICVYISLCSLHMTCIHASRIFNLFNEIYHDIQDLRYFRNYPNFRVSGYRVVNEVIQIFVSCVYVYIYIYSHGLRCYQNRVI